MAVKGETVGLQALCGRGVPKLPCPHLPTPLENWRNEDTFLKAVVGWCLQVNSFGAGGGRAIGAQDDTWGALLTAVPPSQCCDIKAPGGWKRSCLHSGFLPSAPEVDLRGTRSVGTAIQSSGRWCA